MNRFTRFFTLFVIVLLSAYASKGYAQYRDFESSDLPIIIIDTQGNEIVDEPKVMALMGIINNGEGNRNYITDEPNEYDGHIGIEYRGESSQHWPKKSYGVETRDADGENNNVSIFDMPKENDWVLYGPIVDKTLIRNALLYQLGSEISDYAPRTQFCELVINDDYLGVYLFTEKIKKDKGRVDISKPTDENFTGGYLVEMISNESLKPDETHFRMPDSQKEMVVKYPKPSKIKAEQLNYISGYFSDFEQALNSDNYTDETEGYRAYIDLPSFINHMLLSEAFNQLDAFCHSTFFYKDQNEKIHLGPGWDYNRSMGNAKYFNSWRTDVWILKEVYDSNPNGWYRVKWPERMMGDTAFMRAYGDRWKELRKSVFSFDHVFGLIDSYVNLLEESRERNFERWDVLGVDYNNKYVFETYEEEVHYMKNWITEKFTWLDQQFDPAENLALDATISSSGFEDKNPPENAIDGNVDTHWSAEFFPQWIELDLGSVKTISRTIIKPYKERAYRYTISVKNKTTDDYTIVVDRTDNTEGGTIILDSLHDVAAQFVKLTVSGAYNYDGTWCSINEFQVFGANNPSGIGNTLVSGQELLEQNYPNPFDGVTTIGYHVPEYGFVNLKVYSIYGAEVSSLVSEIKSAGNYKVEFNAGNLAPGFYFCKMETAHHAAIKKMILIK